MSVKILHMSLPDFIFARIFALGSVQWTTVSLVCRHWFNTFGPLHVNFGESLSGKRDWPIWLRRARSWKSRDRNSSIELLVALRFWRTFKHVQFLELYVDPFSAAYFSDLMSQLRDDGYNCIRHLFLHISSDSQASHQRDRDICIEGLVALCALAPVQLTLSFEFSFPNHPAASVLAELLSVHLRPLPSLRHVELEVLDEVFSGSFSMRDLFPGRVIADTVFVGEYNEQVAGEPSGGFNLVLVDFGAFDSIALYLGLHVARLALVYKTRLGSPPIPPRQLHRMQYCHALSLIYQGEFVPIVPSLSELPFLSVFKFAQVGKSRLEPTPRFTFLPVTMERLHLSCPNAAASLRLSRSMPLLTHLVIEGGLNGDCSSLFTILGTQTPNLVSLLVLGPRNPTASSSFLIFKRDFANKLDQLTDIRLPILMVCESDEQNDRRVPPHIRFQPPLPVFVNRCCRPACQSYSHQQRSSLCYVCQCNPQRLHRSALCCQMCDCQTAPADPPITPSLYHQKFQSKHIHIMWGIISIIIAVAVLYKKN